MSICLICGNFDGKTCKEQRIDELNGLTVMSCPDFKIDIWKCMTDAGEKEVPFKPQYTRGGWIFTCPGCKQEISSHSYLNVGYFQIACDDHVKECEKLHKEQKEADKKYIQKIRDEIPPGQASPL